MIKPKYQASPISLEDGQYTGLFVDEFGNLLTKDSNAADFLDSLIVAIGSIDDAAWDGVASDATVISLLKAIALNTTPV